MKWFGCVLLWYLVLPETREQEEDCYHYTRFSYYKPGNITVTGIFNENAGENCSSPVDFGVEQMAAAVWTVTALERNNYLPGVKIGLSFFDACSNDKTAHEALAEAILHEHCLNVTSIGMVTTPEIETSLTSFSHKLNKTITRLEHVLDLDGVLTMVAQLLTNLHWTTVNRVIADTHDILTAFSLKMSDEGICVYDEVLTSNKYAMENEILRPIDLSYDEIISKDPPVIVVLSKSNIMSSIFQDMKKLSAKWLLVPTDFTLNVPPEHLPEKVFSVLPLIDNKERLLKFLTDEEMQKDNMNHREATRSPLFLQTTLGILQLLKPFKTIHDKHCQGSAECPQLTRFINDLRTGEENIEGLKSSRITPDQISKALTLLKLDLNDNEPFLYMASLIQKDGKTEDAAIFQVFDTKTHEIKPVPLIVNERLFNERRTRREKKRVVRLNVDDLKEIRRRAEEEVREVTVGTYDTDFAPFDKHPCVDILTQENNNLTRACGICQNFIKFYMRSTRATVEEKDVEEVKESSWSWRYRTWVAINASVASIGVICTTAVSIFIILRMCKGDILEGNPYFSFLILLSIVLLYASTLPYSLNESDNVIICRLKIITPSVSYAILFSIILSRSAMLIFSERDEGIMNHVNGYLQNILCFFICIVQIALTVQFWFYNAMDDFNCEDIHADRRFIILLIYSFFLLSLLVIAAPFTLQSKRNYREGTFFAISTLLVVIVWSVWVTFYHTLPKERDAAVALGLTATATAVLLSVFIPRTYLMATATVRDKITNTLPSLAYLNASNVSEINYKSNQALCDSVTVKYGSPKLGFSNPRIYSVHMSSSAPESPNNFVDGTDYVLNRRKTFIEVSRTESPDNTYDTRESPDMTGKITRF